MYVKGTNKILFNLKDYLTKVITVDIISFLAYRCIVLYFFYFFLISSHLLYSSYLS